MKTCKKFSWNIVKCYTEVTQSKRDNWFRCSKCLSQVIVSLKMLWGKHDRAFLISLTGCTISIIMNYKIVTKYVVRNYVDH